MTTHTQHTGASFFANDLGELRASFGANGGDTSARGLLGQLFGRSRWRGCG